MTIINGLSSNSRSSTPTTPRPSTSSVHLTNYGQKTQSTPSVYPTGQPTVTHMVSTPAGSVRHMVSIPANAKVEDLDLVITNKVTSEKVITTLTKQNAYMSKEIVRLNMELPIWRSELEQAERKWRDSAQGSGHAMETSILEGKMKVLRKQYLDKLNDKAAYEYARKENTTTLKLVPYEDMRETNEYKNYLNNKKNNVPDKIGNYMSEDQKNMYSYLLATGSDRADRYLDILQDSINKAKGTEKANKFIDKLLKNKDNPEKLKTSIYNYFGVSIKGGLDGLSEFAEGVYGVFKLDNNTTPNEYERAIVLSYLKEHSVLYDEIYSVYNAVGNALPAIAVSAVVSAVATPAVGSSLIAKEMGKIAGNIAIGISAHGNAQHKALVDGYDVGNAAAYGLLTGLSKAGLSKKLTTIPGLGLDDGVLVEKMIQEGLKEGTKEWVNAGIKAATLGEVVDLDDVTEDSYKAFVTGFAMSGILNGEKAFADKEVKIKINGEIHNVSLSKMVDALNSEATGTVERAFDEYVGKAEDIQEDKITSFAEFLSERYDQFVEDSKEKVYENIQEAA